MPAGHWPVTAESVMYETSQRTSCTRRRQSHRAPNEPGRVGWHRAHTVSRTPPPALALASDTSLPEPDPPRPTRARQRLPPWPPRHEVRGVGWGGLQEARDKSDALESLALSAARLDSARASIQTGWHRARDDGTGAMPFSVSGPAVTVTRSRRVAS